MKSVFFRPFGAWALLRLQPTYCRPSLTGLGNPFSSGSPVVGQEIVRRELTGGNL